MENTEQAEAPQQDNSDLKMQDEMRLLAEFIFEVWREKHLQQAKKGDHL